MDEDAHSTIHSNSKFGKDPTDHEEEKSTSSEEYEADPDETYLEVCKERKLEFELCCRSHPRSTSINKTNTT